ncbi:MAG: hypothetical protein IPJ16_00755 [Bacteroidales bacterium]|nr:hypothetical protein [Bacteroidales bacterium]
MKTTRNTSSGIFRRRWQTGKRKFIAPSGIVLFIMILISVFTGEKSYSQGVGISESAIPDPHASSILELRSTLRGFLAPRLTTAQRVALGSTAAQGLLVYDTDTKSFWYFDSGWKIVRGSANLGGPNQLLGMNGAGNENEYKNLNGSINITVTHSAGNIGLNTIQDITTTSTPLFSGLNLTNALTVPNGGTGLQSGISGGIPYFSSTTTMASSPLLTANGVVIGGGIGGAPVTIGVGAANTVLRGTGTAPAFGQIVNDDITNGTINLTSKVTGTLPVLNGGTGYDNTYTNGQLLIGNSSGTLTRNPLTGTANQVIVTNGSGSITLTTPQDIHTGATPEFVSTKLTGLAALSGVYTDINKVLTSTPPSSGTIGYWSRNDLLGILTPSNAGDDVTTTGDISTTTTGTITSAGLLTGQSGATITGATSISGGAITLNNSSNNPTSINTGTSTGGVTIGNSANTITLPAFTTAGLVHNSALGVLSTGLLVNSDITNGTIDLTTKVTNVLPIANGGTNSSAALSGSSIIISDGTSIIQGDKGTSTTLLHGNASGSPTYSQVVNADIANGTIDLTSKVTGTLPVFNGGTGVTTFGGANQVLFTTAADALSAVATSTAAGQFLQTSTSGEHRHGRRYLM